MNEIYCIVTFCSKRLYSTSVARSWFSTFEDAEESLMKNCTWYHSHVYDLALIEKVTSGSPDSRVICWYRLHRDPLSAPVPVAIECPEEYKNVCNFAFSF